MRRNIPLKKFLICAILCVYSAAAFAEKTLSPSPKDSIFPQIEDALSGGMSPVLLSIPDLQDKLVDVAKKYARLDYVPYIWGGSKVGTPEVCDACRACVASKKLSLGARLSKCAPCQQCGMDCSHFINHVFGEAGLSYRYASSSEFGRQSQNGLLNIYGFVDVGRDLSLAQPGDVLVFPRHVVLLVRAINSRFGDIIHATRFRDGDYMRLGGFKYDRNTNLTKYRGTLKRILRHQRLFDDKKILHPDSPLRPLNQS